MTVVPKRGSLGTLGLLKVGNECWVWGEVEGDVGDEEDMNLAAEETRQPTKRGLSSLPGQQRLRAEKYL